MQDLALDKRPHYTVPVTTIETKDCAELILLALKEDAPGGDLSSEALIGPKEEGQAHILAKEDGLICGLSLLPILFQLGEEYHRTHISHETKFKDGEKIRKGDIVVKLKGSLRGLLALERVILNFLQYLSGISSQVSRVVEAAGSEIVVLDTRKTLPAFRRLAKYAVYCGGGTNHRIHLSDMVMLKENHIAAVGGIRRAVSLAREKFPKLALEVEIENVEQFEEALGLDVDVILLDNMNRKELEEAAKKMRGKGGGKKDKPFLEISGNWRPEGIAKLKSLGLKELFQRERIGVSMGALTHSVSFLDLSMRLLGNES